MAKVQASVIKDLLIFQTERNILRLSKVFLSSLEELNLPPEEHNRIRKRVLDTSNDSIREIVGLLEKVDF